jgi:hypothetical protein
LGTGNMPGLLIIKDAGVSMRTNDSSCGAVAEVPESITVYTDATVTDTTYTLTPVASYVMLDRSASMLQPPPGATTDSWTSSVNSLTAFVNDQMSNGLDIVERFQAGQGNTLIAPSADCERRPGHRVAEHAQPFINALGG